MAPTITNRNHSFSIKRFNFLNRGFINVSYNVCIFKFGTFSINTLIYNDLICKTIEQMPVFFLINGNFS